MKKFPIIIALTTIIVLIAGVLLFTPKGEQTKSSNTSDSSFNSQDQRYEFYWGIGCPHCAEEEKFIEKMEEKYQIKFDKFEIYNNPQNQKRMIEKGKELSIDIAGIPFLLIDNKPFIGFLNEETSGNEIEDAIIASLNKSNEVIPKAEELEEINEGKDIKTENNSKIISLPLLGEINITNYSLPVLTILIALIDGFNPCAMWTLIFLIGLLMGIKDKKRVWILGSTFIVTSAFVYFLFLSAWLNLFLLLGFSLWMRIIIGLLAIGAGIYYLNDYRKNKNAECKVTNPQQKKSVMEKMKNYVENKKLIFSILGIIILAFSVNTIELVCSAGLPAIYTNILSLSNLPKFNYYAYLLLYVFIFMIDDLFIFISAMVTLKMVGLHTKYSRFSHLIGGIIMLIIGVLLLFKPDLLMFG